MIFRPLANTSSILYAKKTTRSIADRLGSALLCCGLNTPYVNAVYAILLAISLSKPFAIQESRAIGRQDLTSVLTFFPVLGIITISANFQASGK